jgi:alpha-1,2-mannosyltransferase
MNAQPRRRALVWFAAALTTSFLATAGFYLGIAAVSGPTRETFKRALKATAPAQVLRLQDLSTTDSWRPMLKAYQSKLQNPQSDLYAVFFVDHIKFQYPPPSLLMFDLFPRSMTRIDGDVVARPLRRVLAWMSRGAVVLTVLTSVLIFELGLRRLPSDQRVPPAHVAASIGLSLALGLTYYPVLFGHFLGQMQVFLNALLALALLFSLAGRPTLAGLCFGACCLVKPHYGLVLVWSLLTRQWRFTVGLAGVVLGGLAISIARFGLADHLRYLDVLRVLSSGEYYWTNQSVNGLLNRLLEHGSQLQPVITEFAPYHPLVYALTVLSSVAILALAFWPLRHGPRADRGTIDLMVLLVAITLASPIVWIHHYGAFLPVFAALLPGLLYARPLGRATVPLFAAGYLATANLLMWPHLMFLNPWLGLTGSLMFYGGLTFFGLLLALRAAGWQTGKL